MGTPIAFMSGTTNGFSVGATKRATIGLNTGTSLVSGNNWWNGVDVGSQYLLYSDQFSQGQSVIPTSRPTAWSTPTITDQNLLNLINTLPDRVGLTPFVNINVALQWLQNSQKYLLLKNGYENIVTDGLVLNLDAGWANSYPGTGTVWTDLSGQGNNGNMINGPTLSTDGLGSIFFDGADDYVNCGSASSFNILRTVSMELWFKMNGFGSPWTNIFGKMNADGDSPTRCYTAFINSEGFIHLVTADSTQEYLNSSNFISLGTWYHWVGVIDRNSGEMKQYVNGILNATGPVRTTDITTNSDPVRVGYQGTVYSKLNGIVAVARIYNKVLSADEVQKNYDVEKSRFGFWGQTLWTGNTQYYDFTKQQSYNGAGSTVSDLSGNGYNGTFNNGGFTTFQGVKCFNATDTGAWISPTLVTLSNNYTIFVWANMLSKSQVSSWRTLLRSLEDINASDHELIVKYDENLLGYYDNKTPSGFHSYGINVENAALENIWILYALVGENGTTQKVYINDGSLNASVNYNATGQKIMTIGNYQGGAQQWGYVSNYILYNNQAFTQAQVAQYFNATKQYYGYASNNILNNGLVLSLDAGQAISYPQSGSVWYDLTPYGNNGTLTNGPIFNSGNTGNIVFDGTNDSCYRASLTNPITNVLTFNIWVKFSDTGSGGRYVMAVGRDVGGEIGGMALIAYGFSSVSSGQIIFEFGSAKGRVSSGIIPTTGIWYNLTATADGSNTKFYVNSVLANTSSQGTGSVATSPGLSIGSYLSANIPPDPTSYFLNGAVGAVQIYNRALNSQEVLRNFNAQKARFGL